MRVPRENQRARREVELASVRNCYDDPIVGVSRRRPLLVRLAPTTSTLSSSDEPHRWMSVCRKDDDKLRKDFDVASPAVARPVSRGLTTDQIPYPVRRNRSAIVHQALRAPRGRSARALAG